MSIKIINGILLTTVLAYGCQQNSSKQHTTDMRDSLDLSFDTVIDSKDVKLYTLMNGKLKAALTNYGARLVNLQVPNRRET